MGKGGEIFVFDMGKPVRIAEQKEKIAKSDLLPKVAFVAADNFKW